MTITTAQLKAAIEAKIAAATGSTSLEDLTLIKNNADTWLLNNSGGTITGYASLETLIQAKQDALTGGSTIDDITLISASVFPTVVPDNGVFYPAAVVGLMFIGGDGNSTIATITPPSGKRVKVTLLAGNGGNHLGVSLRANGVDVAGGVSHRIITPSAGMAGVGSLEWNIGSAGNSICSEILFKPDAVVTVYNGNLQSLSSTAIALAYQIEG